MSEVAESQPALLVQHGGASLDTRVGDFLNGWLGLEQVASRRSVGSWSELGDRAVRGVRRSSGGG